MKVAINARDSVGVHRGGIGRYAINLLETLSDISFSDSIALSVFLSKEDTARDRRARELMENARISTISLPSSHAAVKLYFDHVSLVQHLDQNSSDILHCLKFVLPLVRTIPENMKKVVTVHDLIFLTRPELFPFTTREYWKRAVKKSVKLTDAIIVPSRFTKEQVFSAYGRRIAEKCEVIPHGLDPVFDLDGNKTAFSGKNQPRKKKKRIHLPTNKKIRPNNTKQVFHDFHGNEISPEKEFFLCVGTIEPRKNLQNIIRAFETLATMKRSDNTNLVWVGKMGWESKAIFDLVKERGLAERIVFLHDVDDEHLADLYRRAIALVYPSLSEGFGLPVLEAMGSGCPVIHSGRGALTEVTGGHELRIEPTEPDSIADAMIRIRDDDELGRRMMDNGRRRAKQFTWKAAGEKLLKVYEDL